MSFCGKIYKTILNTLNNVGFILNIYCFKGGTLNVSSTGR